MNNEEIKKILISEINDCENKDLLLEALLLLIGSQPSLHNYTHAKETETAYETHHTSPVPQEHWDLIKKQSEKLEGREITGKSWAVVEAEMKEKHGL